jgi:hypothetical protein
MNINNNLPTTNMPKWVSLVKDNYRKKSAGGNPLPRVFRSYCSPYSMPAAKS